MKNDVTLTPMTRALCHELYQGWENDPAIYINPEEYKVYHYNAAAVDRYFDHCQEPSRVLFAVMLGGRCIGEVHLKHIDRALGECTLSIHLQNDAVKGRGCGTQAERLALRYAFDELGANAVNADTIRSNTRSQHILDKLGFRFLTEDGEFRYYRIERGEFS